MDPVITIEGVTLRPLKIFKDERGQVMHMLRRDSSEFENFGEIYFSMTNPKVVKAWKLHLKKSQLLSVPIGSVKFVLIDKRPDSPSFGDVNEIEIGEDNYQLLKIPNNIIYGFQTTSSKPSLIANCADLPHDEGEAQGFSIEELASTYSWN